jgi:hypothetical protein
LSQYLACFPIYLHWRLLQQAENRDQIKMATFSSFPTKKSGKRRPFLQGEFVSLKNEEDALAGRSYGKLLVATSDKKIWKFEV